ncbi:hypothetical protein [Acinetobacter sp. ACNIH2]|nr:hypothetical protein [Acinetobacter sp. ACNIH2]
MTIQDIQSLAEAHGLLLTDKMNGSRLADLYLILSNDVPQLSC